MSLRFACAILAVGCTEIEYADTGSGAANSTGGTELGGGGTGGSGGGASGGGATGGSTPEMEVCGNEVDDDLDQLTDCEDPECAVVCELLPAGWTGFASVRSGSCGAEESLAQTAYLSASGDSDCACACGAPTCGSVVATAYGATGCSGGTLVESLDQACTIVGNQGAESLRVVATNTCGAPVASLVNPAFSSESANLCVGDEGTCVFQSGVDLPCPAGFPMSSQLYADVTDTRGCEPSGCDCSSPDCGDISLHATSGCGGAVTPIPLGSCVPHTGRAGMTFTPDPNPSCTAGGAALESGAVALSAPLTVCCP